MAKVKTDKRTAILSAALEIFAAQGFHGAPTSQIAQKAEVGTGTIYRYFENKDDLINALHEDVETLLLPAMMAGVDEQAPIRENFLLLLANIMRYLIDNPASFRFLEQYYNSPYGIKTKREKSTGCDTPLIALFKRGIEQQVVKALPEEVLFALSFGPVVMLVRDHMAGYFAVTDEMIQMTLEASWDALKR